MTKALPDIVKWKLKTSVLPAGATHPNFGVLTAFIEGSLDRTQRNEILAHLANCARCNQLVVLAAPSVTEEVVVRKVKKTWHLWNLVPFPRFVIPSCAAALVLLAVWTIRPTRVESPVARVSEPPSIVATAPSVTPSRSSNNNKDEISVAPARRKSALPVVAKALPPKPTGVEFANEHGNQGLSANAADVTMETTLSPATSTAGLPAAAVRTSTQTPTSSMVSAPAAGPCWKVSDAGRLQKSTTCGDGWIDVSFDVPVFVRVMHSAANNIWVGGNGGALYHSEDAGEHWSRVSVPTLKDDIVAIAFATPVHGRLATADGAAWATNDGGITWKRL